MNKKRTDKEILFTELLDKHKPQIQRICWGFTSNEADVKDIYQEVIINIWKGLDGFKNQAAYSTWMHRIAINTCLLWKKRKPIYDQISEKLTSKKLVYEMVVDSSHNPELINLKRAINKLKNGDKALILLVLEELSYKEIAEVTGMSISNIGVKINRIKTRLKKHLSN